MIRKIKHVQQRAIAVLTGVVAIFGITIAGFVSTASAGTLDFGKVGEPVNLIIGYQPYYTEAWSGGVMC